jgi:hypothetical protein
MAEMVSRGGDILVARLKTRSAIFRAVGLLRNAAKQKWSWILYPGGRSALEWSRSEFADEGPLV